MKLTVFILLTLSFVPLSHSQQKEKKKLHPLQKKELLERRLNKQSATAFSRLPTLRIYPTYL